MILIGLREYVQLAKSAETTPLILCLTSGRTEFRYDAIER
jgi:hypothetical protein